MAIVVSCPECQRKLKIAPASAGKSVKCPCGNVFKAQAADEPPLAVATPVAPATLVVACDNCQAKLKVPVSARGRKMKCSKCNATFVVPAEEAPAAPPEWSKPTPATVDDEEPTDEPRAAKKFAPSRPPFFEDADADEPAPMRKSAASQPPFIEDDEPVADVAPPPRTKGKPAARSAVAKEPAASQTPAPASGCGGCVLSVFVLFIVFAYFAVLVPLYFFRTDIEVYVKLPFEKPPPPEHGKVPHIAPHPQEDGDRDILPPHLNDKPPKGFDNDKDKKEKGFDDDKDKKDKGFDNDKDKKDKPLDKEKKDLDDKDAGSDRNGLTLLQVPAPVIAASPALEVGRPPKPRRKEPRVN